MVYLFSLLLVSDTIIIFLILMVDSLLVQFETFSFWLYICPIMLVKNNSFLSNSVITSSYHTYPPKCEEKYEECMAFFSAAEKKKGEGWEDHCPPFSMTCILHVLGKIFRVKFPIIKAILRGTYTTLENMVFNAAWPGKTWVLDFLFFVFHSCAQYCKKYHIIIKWL